MGGRWGQVFVYPIKFVGVYFYFIVFLFILNLFIFILNIFVSILKEFIFIISKIYVYLIVVFSELNRIIMMI